MGSGNRGIWNAAILAFVLAAALLMAADTRADPDLWGHVLFGRQILVDGEISRVDPYSYLSAGQEWINHEWLSEVLFGAAWEGGGSAGIVLLKALIGLLVALGLFAHLRRRGLDSLRAGVVLALVLSLVRVGLLTARPHLFTYVLFLSTLLVIDRVDRGERGWLWTLPFIMAVWVNVHGGFLAGLGILAFWGGAHLVVDVLDAERRRRLSRWEGLALPVALLLAAGATLANPYGWELLEFLIRTATVARPEIEEWQPLDITSATGALYLSLVLFTGFCLVRSERRLPVPQLVVLVVVTLLPLDAVRHLPLFALGAGVLGADHFASVLASREDDSRQTAPEDASPRLRVAVAILVFGVAGTLAARAVTSVDCIRIPREDYPIEAVRFLDDSGLEGNLGVFFNWGEYAIWHLWPRFRVAMDGRRETVYADSIYEEHLDFIWGLDDWDAVLDKRPTDLVLVGDAWPVGNLMALKPGWRRIYRDSVASIYVRQGVELPATIDRIGTSATGSGDGSAAEPPVCFP